MNAILVSIDSLRADHVGFLGYNWPTTPYLDSLAEESLVFEKALVAGMPTYYSFPAILASRYPLVLGRDVVGLAPDELTLATALNEAGYATAAFLAGNPYLSRRFHYHQGFDHFEDFLPSEGRAQKGSQNGPRQDKPFRSVAIQLRRLHHALERTADLWRCTRSIYNELYFHYSLWANRHGTDERSDPPRQYPAADVVVDSALAWLGQKRKCPFFMWVHLMDPHHPYYPPVEMLAGLGQSEVTVSRALYLNAMWNRGDVSNRRLERYRSEVVALYDAGIRWADEQVKRLVGALYDQGLWDSTLFVMTSDHGEEFLDHGGRYHYPVKLTQELVRVPLLFHLPAGKLQRRLTSPFSLIDLAPTMLDMLGVTPPIEFAGRIRWQENTIDDSPEALAITECVYNCRNPLSPRNRLGPRLLTVQDQRYKLAIEFTTGEDRLFDLQRDPGEAEPLPEGVACPARRRLFEAALAHLRRSRPVSNSLPRMRARLADLKYSLASGHEQGI